ncbi:predicted protein [Botrytis cinerea T4]|uniref:Uncharacterized protein n=1 Tax=Botryotinia fuckeliana (strain T4) TaxID=999810 RepID=G2XWC0_BOTF4|nr:predicted protein [Botrytis cinerea T4]
MGELEDVKIYPGRDLCFTRFIGQKRTNMNLSVKLGTYVCRTVDLKRHEKLED